MKDLSVLFICVFGLLLSNATNANQFNVYFASGKAQVEKNQLDPNLFEGDLFYLNGFADIDGDSSANMNLSRQRVENVKAILINNGVHANNIYCNYFGESLFNPNQNEEEKAASRLVEIRYIKDPLLKHAVEKEVFTLHTKKDNTVTGKQGTKIRIPANCFTDSLVEIHLQEFYSPLDILSANLSTKADGEILETRGMLYLEAFSNGQAVSPTKELQIEFASLGDGDSGFQIFEGEVNGQMNVNWGNARNAMDAAQVSATTYDSYYGWMYWHSYEDFNAYEVNEFSPMFINNLANRMGKVHRDYMDSTSAVLHVEKNGSVSLQSYAIKHGTKKEQEALVKDIMATCERTKAKASESAWEFELSFDTIPVIPIEYNESYMLNVYVYPSMVLGWINCDRFINVANRTNFKVAVAPESNVRMIVKDYMSFFNSSVRNGNTIEFNNIPAGTEVILIATLTKDKEHYLAIEETVVGSKTFTDFNYEKMSVEDLQEKVKAIKL